MTWVQQAKDFASEQIPLVVEEILMYSLVSEVLLVLIALAVMGGYGLFVRWVIKNKKLDDDADEGVAIFCVIIFGVGGVAAAIALLCFISDMLDVIKIVFAPRVFVIEYLKNFT